MAEEDWFAMTASGKVEAPIDAAIRPIRILGTLAFTGLAVVFAMASVVANYERSPCIGRDCEARPETFTRALWWLLTLGAFRSSAPVTWMSRTIGILFLIALSVLFATFVVALRRQAVYRRAKGLLVYEILGNSVLQKSTVLVLVVNDTECLTTIRALTERTQTEPVHSRIAGYAVHRLGAIGSAEVILAQTQQGTVKAGGMTLTSRAILEELRPTAAILAGVCYGLNSGELDDGDQKLGDIIVSDLLLPLDHKKITEGSDGLPREENRGEPESPDPRLLSHAKALTLSWTRTAAHMGLTISLNTLVNSGSERQRLKTLAPTAIGGEMELAGLSASASWTGTVWLMVKGISDWGVGKADDHQELAARNAADFVAELIGRAFSDA